MPTIGRPGLSRTGTLLRRHNAANQPVQWYTLPPLFISGYTIRSLAQPPKSRKAANLGGIRFFHIDIAEVQTAEGKLYLFVAIDRTSKFAFVQLVESANRVTASAFLVALIAAVPYKIHTVLTDNGIQFRLPPRLRQRANRTLYHAYVRYALPGKRHRAPLHQNQSSMDKWTGRTNEPDHQGSNRQTLPLRQP